MKIRLKLTKRGEKMSKTKKAVWEKVEDGTLEDLSKGASEEE